MLPMPVLSLKPSAQTGSPSAHATPRLPLCRGRLPSAAYLAVAPEGRSALGGASTLRIPAALPYSPTVTIPEPVPEETSLPDDPAVRSELIDLTKAIKRCRTWKELRQLYWANRTRQGAVNMVSYFTQLATLLPNLADLLEGAEPNGLQKEDDDGDGGYDGANDSMSDAAAAGKAARGGRQARGNRIWVDDGGGGGSRGAGRGRYRAGGSDEPVVYSSAERAALRQLVVRLVYDACSFTREHVAAERLYDVLSKGIDPWDTEVFQLYLRDAGASAAAEAAAAQADAVAARTYGGWPYLCRTTRQLTGPWSGSLRLAKQRWWPPTSFWEWLRDHPTAWVDPVATRVKVGLQHWAEEGPTPYAGGVASAPAGAGAPAAEIVLNRARKRMPLCFGPLELATLAWAAARLQLHRALPEHASWLLQDLLGCSYSQMGAFDGRQLAQLAYSLTQLGPWVPSARWRRRFLAATRRRMHEMDSQSIANLAHSLEPLQLRPDPPWLRDLMASSGSLMEQRQMGPPELTQLAWAVFRARHGLYRPRAWTAEVLDVARHASSLVCAHSNASTGVPPPHTTTAAPEHGLEPHSSSSPSTAPAPVSDATTSIHLPAASPPDRSAALVRVSEVGPSQPPPRSVPQRQQDRLALQQPPSPGGQWAAAQLQRLLHELGAPPLDAQSLGELLQLLQPLARQPVAGQVSPQEHPQQQQTGWSQQEHEVTGHQQEQEQGVERPSWPGRRCTGDHTRDAVTDKLAVGLEEGYLYGNPYRRTDPWVTDQPAHELLAQVAALGGQQDGALAGWLLKQPPAVFLALRLWATDAAVRRLLGGRQDAASVGVDEGMGLRRLRLEGSEAAARRCRAVARLLTAASTLDGGMPLRRPTATAAADSLLPSAIHPFQPPQSSLLRTTTTAPACSPPIPSPWRPTQPSGPAPAAVPRGRTSTALQPPALSLAAAYCAGAPTPGHPVSAQAPLPVAMVQPVLPGSRSSPPQTSLVNPTSNAVLPSDGRPGETSVGISAPTPADAADPSPDAAGPPAPIRDSESPPAARQASTAITEGHPSGTDPRGESSTPDPPPLDPPCTHPGGLMQQPNDPTTAQQLLLPGSSSEEAQPSSAPELLATIPPDALVLKLHTACWPGPRWLDTLASAGTAQLRNPSFRAQNLGTLLWSLAGLGYQPPPGWILPWLDRLPELWWDFRPANLVSVLCALSAWREMPQGQPAAALRAAAVRLLPNMGPRELELAASALAQLCEMPAPATDVSQSTRSQSGLDYGGGMEGDGAGGSSGVVAIRRFRDGRGGGGGGNRSSRVGVDSDGFRRMADPELFSLLPVPLAASRPWGNVRPQPTRRVTSITRMLDPRVGELLVKRAVQVSYSYSPRHMTRVLRCLVLRLRLPVDGPTLGAMLGGHAVRLEAMAAAAAAARRRLRRSPGRHHQGTGSAGVASGSEVLRPGSTEGDRLIRDLLELVVTALDAAWVVYRADTGREVDGAGVTGAGWRGDPEGDSRGFRVLTDEEAAAMLPVRWWRAYVRVLEALEG